MAMQEWEVFVESGHAADHLWAGSKYQARHHAARYLRADLTCGECAHVDFDASDFIDEEAPCMAGERAEVQKDTKACMAFVPKEER